MKSEQFNCPCGCGLNYGDMNNGLLSLLTIAERISGHVFHINSGIRCVEHNASIPGSSRTSSHLPGLAADIRTANSRERYNVLNGLITAGVHRIGIYPGRKFIHADNDTDKTGRLVWSG